MKELKQFVNNITTVGPDVYQLVESLAFVKKFEKGEFLLRQGSICKHIYLVISGALRVFQHDDGREITSRFTTPGMVITSYYSMISSRATQENIQAIENAEVIMIPYNPLEQQFEKYHVLERLGRKILEDYFIKKEERIMLLQSKSAMERYQILLSDQAELLQFASLGHIASYLGITQETLSRIRKKAKQ